MTSNKASFPPLKARGERLVWAIRGLLGVRTRFRGGTGTCRPATAAAHPEGPIRARKLRFRTSPVKAQDLRGPCRWRSQLPARARLDKARLDRNSVVDTPQRAAVEPPANAGRVARR